MTGRGSWGGELKRLALLITGVTLVGWLAGYPLQVFAIVVFLALIYWGYQLWRVERWMSNPEAEPPESHGVWGAIFDNIYLLQRRNREARTRLQTALDYLQDSLASMRDAAIMVDHRGAIEWSNAAAERMLGLRYPEDRGQNYAIRYGDRVARLLIDEKIRVTNLLDLHRPHHLADDDLDVLVVDGHAL